MWRIALVMTVVTALVLFFGGPLWQQHRARQDTQANKAALQEYAPVVRPAIRALLAYDYRDFDGAVARGRSFLTGPFAAEYTATMASLRTTALAEQVVVTVNDPSLSLDKRGRQRAEVRAYVYQERRSNRLAGVESTYCEVLVTLERVESGWKVARFAIQPNPRIVRVSPTK
ncbi:hypothetical protein [Catellatospora sichuanensis]|uniref:hypothetical protein n=1 Tax=Catellatospora sichuanensis TaxID=1969805 RepID=UPI001181E09F|nr:hypothetical protein [Catellatospora sichuanensis]